MNIWMQMPRKLGERKGERGRGARNVESGIARGKRRRAQWTAEKKASICVRARYGHVIIDIRHVPWGCPRVPALPSALLSASCPLILPHHALPLQGYYRLAAAAADLRSTCFGSGGCCDAAVAATLLLWMLSRC